MKVLNLSHNGLTRFEDAWHYNWLGLEVLDLSYNAFSGRMSSGQLNFIKFNPSKFHVNLAFNNIEEFSDDVVLEEERINDNLVEVNIEGNPVSSDCHLMVLNNSHITLRGFQESCFVIQGS